MKLDPNKQICGNILVFAMTCSLINPVGECKECYEEKLNEEVDGQKRLFY